MKPAKLRPLAEQDLVERTRYYVGVDGSELGDRFFASAIEAVRSAEAMPGVSSPLVGERVGIDGLRRAGVDGFPCGWFSIERADHLDVIRLLADKQDLEDLLGGGGETPSMPA